MHTQPLTAYRAANLCSLIGISASERDDYSPRGKALILNLLRANLKSERARGKRKHWSYNLNRHLALIDALKLERIAFQQLHPLAALRAEAENSRPFIAALQAA